jgi:hypothetical protein
MHLPLTKSEDSDICSANNHLCGPVSFSPIGSSTRSAYQPFLFLKALQSIFHPPCLPCANHHSLATPEYCTCAILRPSWLCHGYELKIGQIGWGCRARDWICTRILDRSTTWHWDWRDIGTSYAALDPPLSQSPAFGIGCRRMQIVRQLDWQWWGLQLTFGQCKNWAGSIDCRWRSSGSQHFLIFQPPCSLSTRAIEINCSVVFFSSAVAIQDVQD